MTWLTNRPIGRIGALRDVMGLVGALLLGGMTPARAQLPTIDAAAVAQLVQQVQQATQAVQTLQSQLTQMQSLVGATTGGHGMDAIAGVLNQPGVRAALPDSTADLLGSVSSAITAYGTLSGAAQSIRNGGQITTYPGDAWYAQEMARLGNRRAVEMAMSQQIYDTAVTRRAALDTLRQQLATTTDQATALQLQARIQVEAAQGINDLQAYNALLMEQRANQGLDDQRQNETGSAAISDMKTRMGNPNGWWR
jgi:type IV secretion system protein VirB5